jgi:hypothetical protein
MSQEKIEQSYSPNPEKRLGSSAVFFEALSVSKKFSETLVTNDELVSFWRNNDDIESLNEALKEQKLRSEIVTLSGPGVYVSNVTMELLSNSTNTNAVEKDTPDDTSIDALIDGHIVSGKLDSFSVRFEKTLEADVFAPKLTYRVGLGRRRSPFADVDHYAMGDVGVSQLEFAKDKLLDRRDDIISSLIMIAPWAEEEIHQLKSCLEQIALTTKGLAYAAFKAQEIVNEASIDLRGLMEDMFADLISHYVKRDKSPQVKTPVYMVPSPADTAGKYTFVSRWSSPRTFNQNVDGVMFLDKYTQTHRGFSAVGQRALYLVFNIVEDDTTAYVPIHELQEYSQAKGNV